MLDSFRRDCTYALRSFRRSPGLTLVVIFSIGIGIAANTVVFSMANELLMREPPVRDPDRLVTVQPGQNPSSSYPEYLDFREQSGTVLEGFAAHGVMPVSANLSSSGRPERVWGQVVSGNWFPLTGVPLWLGRSILPRDDGARGANPVVVLGYGLWRRLGADPSIAGKNVVLSGVAYTVVGVTEPGFFGLDRGLASEFWAPLSMRYHLAPDMVANEQNRNNCWLEYTGRLRPGVTREQAVAALNVIYHRIVAEHEKGQKPKPVVLRKAGASVFLVFFERELHLFLIALGVVTILVLLIACANVANLLLARSAARQQEISVRLALGASRGRLIRQLLTESVLLATAGAALGFLLAVPGAQAVARFQLPLPATRCDFSPDSRVLAFTTALAVITGILFGLAPAISGTRGNLAGSRFRRKRLSRWLVGVQVALSMVLLLASGLFLRSLQKAASIDTGMKPDGVLMLAIDPKGQGYPPEKAKRFFTELQQRVEASPGVSSMGYTDLPPLALAVNNCDVVDADSATGTRAAGNAFFVGGHYFQAAGISLLQGRDFIPGRDDKAPVAVINELLATKLFGRTNPIGRHVRKDEDRSSYEIIGVVRNAKSETLTEADQPGLYRYFSDFGQALAMFGVTVMVRGSGDPLALARSVREQVDVLDRDLPLFNVKTLRSQVSDALLIPRVSGVLFGAFGTIGLALAVIGLYGLVNYSVRTRTREIGIRIALGACGSEVATFFGREVLFVVAAGLAVGLAAAFALSRLIASMLYGITGTDPLVFAGVTCVMVAAAVLAVIVPALRASQIDPTSALRYE